MLPGRDWSGDVCDVGKHARADTARDLSDALEVDRTRIRRSAADEQLRPVLFSDLLQFVVVDLFRLFRNAVVGNFVTESREVKWMTLREVSAVREIHAEDLIAILNRREVHGHVRLRTAVRLHVRVVFAK